MSKISHHDHFSLINFALFKENANNCLYKLIKYFKLNNNIVDLYF